MNHSDHVALLQPGFAALDAVAPSGAVWADLGAGQGAFTRALADLLGPGATIHTIDRDRRALEQGAAETTHLFPRVTIVPHAADFSAPLLLPPLDGLVMANALHFVRDGDKEPLLRRLRALLKPGGRFLLVEYNVDRGNMWVPHPLAYDTWRALATRAGFAQVTLLARAPSRFLGEFYASAAW